MGINYVFLSKQKGNDFIQKYEKLSNNLYKLNFDEKSYLFRCRSHSKYWNYETSHLAHYKESDEKTLNSNAIAIVFWSYLPKGLFDIERIWQSIETHFYNPELKLWKRSTAHPLKFRAIDHAILLLAAHRTLKCSHYLNILSDERKQYLNNLITELINTLLHTFNYADTSAINTYIVLEEEHLSRHHASYVQNNAIPIKTDDNEEPVTIRRFAWQDVWITLALQALKVDVRYLIDDIYKTFCDKETVEEQQQAGGLLFNEPRQNKKTSWGARLCVFTGDNALFFLLLCREGIEKEHPHTRAFDELLRTLIKSGHEPDHCFVGEAKQFPSPSLWASSELVFSLLLSTRLFDL